MRRKSIHNFYEQRQKSQRRLKQEEIDLLMERTKQKQRYFG